MRLTVVTSWTGMDADFYDVRSGNITVYKLD